MSQWALRPLWRDFTVQRQVVGAIMMRELVTRWGRRDLGFAWLFCEPLVFAFPVIAIWTYVRTPYEHGLPITAFVWTGYMPILIFRHVTGGALYSFRNNAAMLYHRRVTPLDLFIGRQGLEALGNLASVAFFCRFRQLRGDGLARQLWPDAGGFPLHGVVVAVRRDDPREPVRAQ
jgi:capsular polysaccharide transport system permease protein